MSFASLMAQMIKNLPAMWETRVQSLGWEDPLKKGMAIHSSILAWRIPWREEPGRPQSMGSQRVRHNWVINTFTSHKITSGFFKHIWEICYTSNKQKDKTRGPSEIVWILFSHYFLSVHLINTSSSSVMCQALCSQNSEQHKDCLCPLALSDWIKLKGICKAAWRVLR